MISSGNHKAKAIAGVFGGERAKEQVEVKFEITDGPDRGQTISWFGFFYGSDADKEASNKKRSTESLLHAGWDGEFSEELRFAPDAEVVLVIEHEKVVKNNQVELDDHGQPKLRARVRWVNAPGGGLVMKDRLDKSGLADFKRRMSGIVIDTKKRLGTSAQNGGGSGGSRVPARGGPEQGFGNMGDDEIPFICDARLLGWERP